MATQRTSNLNLVLPFQDDPVAVSDVNNNMTVIDAAANALEDGLAIVSNGNTHPAITSGQFVYIRNHSTLTEGLYRATSNIAANGSLTSSNVVADSNGGLNTLYEQIGKVPVIDESYYFTSAGSKSYTLPNSVTYLLIINVWGSADSNSSGLYLISPNSYAGNVNAIASSNLATVALSDNKNNLVITVSRADISFRLVRFPVV